MGAPSLFFFGIFAIPLIAFLIWLMRKDKRKGIFGIIVLIILVVFAIAASLKASKSELDRQKYEEIDR
ncbi:MULTISPECIES: archaellin/type IV pilin N-terminal domain-containing protein [Sphingobacteriaceae]|uniref:archaellin/type IV pilin N-terminal domain-containing protein n=1 Tax=Olivibacter jilunii TaxID=985016 RepID=UPI0002DFB05C